MPDNPPPQPAGIDIGTEGLHICTPTTKKPVFVPFKGNYTAAIAAIIPPGSLCACEPTGWHYSAPVLRILKYIGAQALIVENRATGRIRTELVSTSKTDETDARTLMQIAQMHLNGQRLRSAHLADMGRIDALRALRILIYAHTRATKEQVRTTNRLRQIAHSIAPECAQHFPAWSNCASLSAVSAPAIKALTPTDLKPFHHLARKSIKALQESLPPWADGEEMTEVALTELEALRTIQPRTEQLAAKLTALIETPTFAWLTALWRTVPYSADPEIAKLIAACNGSPADYTRDQFLSAIGGQPKARESGKTKASTMNTAGFRPARAAATLWTSRFLMKGDNPITAYAEQLKGRGAKVRPRARAKLINILWGIAVSHTPYNPHHGEKA